MTASCSVPALAEGASGTGFKNQISSELFGVFVESAKSASDDVRNDIGVQLYVPV